MLPASLCEQRGVSAHMRMVHVPSPVCVCAEGSLWGEQLRTGMR